MGESSKRAAARRPPVRKGSSRSRVSGGAADSRPEHEPPKKKNLRLHQSKIDAARAVLGTTTETETIELALDLIVFRDELVQGVQAMRGAGLVNVLDEE